MFRLARRGHLRRGDLADVVVFDPARFRQKADYLKPRVLADGVVALLVNGRLAVEHGVPTGVAAGRPIRRTPPQGSCALR